MKQPTSVEGDSRRVKEAEAGENRPETPPAEKHPYPKSIGFIIGNEFCERFSYYGMKAILALYLNKKLKFSQDTATVIYHTFSGLCYFTPLFGALLADTLLGKFKTIMYLSLIYVLGLLLKTLAAIPTIGIPPVEFSLLGLALIALGTGGIKPCVSAFGGDQFKLPQQERQLQTYFSIFYFAINAGSLLSTFITPFLRKDVPCFDDDSCYSLAFGVPAALMLIATLILFVGKGMYNMKAPQGNIIIGVAGSIWYALKKNRFWVFCRGRGNDSHWMDTALEKYPRHLVEDVKLLLKVLFIYLPLPVFWALYDQQGSRWTFQANGMDGLIGSSATILPEHMQMVNPILILVLIPIFDRIVYPICAKCNFLVKPLQRMTVGGCLTAAAFIISGFLELSLKPSYDHVPKPHESHLHLMNSFACPVSVTLSRTAASTAAFSSPTVVGGELRQPESVLHQQIDALANTILYDLVPGSTYGLKVEVGQDCKYAGEEGAARVREIAFEAVGEKVSGVVIRSDSGKGLHVVELPGFERPGKLENSNNIRAVLDFVGSSSTNHTLEFRPYGDKEHAISLEAGFHNDLVTTNYTKVTPSHYEIYFGDSLVGDLDVRQGGVRTLYVVRGGGDGNKDFAVVDFFLTRENDVHILWLIPQYVVITVGEILFSITGLEFSYSQAPESMKSVLQAAWLWTVAFGNVIVIIVAEVKAFDDQAGEFFMFAGLMFADMILFALMAYFYKYVDVAKLERERKTVEEEVKKEKSSTLTADTGSSTDL